MKILKRLKNPRIENWSLGLELPHKYAAPEQCEMCLKGFVTNHPHLDSGNVTTTRVLSINLEKNTAKTKNTMYDLGDMHPKYKAWLEERNKTVEDVVNNS